MMTIQVAKINIKIDFIFENEFHNISSFQVNELEEYCIQSHAEGFYQPLGMPETITEFFDLYRDSNKTIQVQKNNGRIVGSIVYDHKHVDLYLVENNFVTEYLLSQYALLYILRQKKDALFIHGSSIVYHSKGILFSAKSGTGKSTHARLWRTYTDAESLNDDKNIIVNENDQLWLYSNPWSGKHQIHQNLVAPISCIVFLYQSKVNEVRQLKPHEAMRILLGQIEAPRKDGLENWNQMVDRVLELPIYYYGCNMEKDAVDTLKKRLEMDLCL